MATKATKTAITTKAMKAATPKRGNPLLVTTAHKGVFFGYSTYSGGDAITLTDCRNVLYWGKAARGFLGLAVTGPDDSCRVGPAAAATTLNGVTSVTEVSAEAVAKFESAPWSN